ncbi:hypothetical protein [Microbacterium dauci]|uniref:Proteins of 100 residues with WXG n=1 Tax=Microbacterium dauci TaxID=3048008 RepID=A0ABT6ZGW9_9MICO|nr:hypothetical protein [Microbacterium sp. LX3-4]MDJ1115385.1 hypothetical protein [Microbacterium sp. LX3-4]
MASVHEIGIAANTREFDEGIRSGVVKPLGDAEEAFTDLATAAGRASQDGARSLDKLEDELRDVQKASKRADDSMRDLGDGGKRGFDRVKGGASELSQEMGQNLGEAVSSFRGDMSDLGQVGQDTLGGLAATLAGAGPAGLVGAAALAAGAVGLGAVTASLQEADEKQQALAESAAEWASAYQESAGKIVSASHVVAEVQDIATNEERYKQAKQNATDWGTDVATAMRAMAGDATALEVATSSLNDKQREWGEVLRETSTGSGMSYDKSTMTAEQRELGQEIARGTEALGLQSEAMRLGKEQAENASRALYDYATSAGTATDKTDDLGNTIYKLPDGKEIVIDADAKTAHEDLDALEQRELAEKTVTVRTVVDDSDWRNYTPAAKNGTIRARVHGANGRLWE